MRYYLTLIFIFTLLAVPWLMVNYPKETDYALSIAKSMENQFASAVLARNPKSVTEIQSRYISTSPRKVRVLIVPGHEPSNGGANFGSVYERDMAVELSDKLNKLLVDNGRYEVIQTRTQDAWNPVFKSYFTDTWDSIVSWQKEAKREDTHMIQMGQMKKAIPLVSHNDAAAGVAMRLYGITKWANENDIDITIHVHFNDYPRYGSRTAGEYSGFSIYVPERQLGNSSTTQAIANNVFKRLSRYNPVSDLPIESGGIIEEPELIAVGVFNTAASASMVIEYGYIYEPQFNNPEIKDKALSDLAFQTYLGLQDFFGSGNNVTHAYDTLVLPKTFNRQISKTGFRAEDVFDLQTALILEGMYPPKGKTKNECPRSGKLGPCTESAVESFQKKNSIYDEVGVVGQKTLGVLNQLYSVGSR
jgi:N-acetylmuramoyl-L-alanine amidase